MPKLIRRSQRDADRIKDAGRHPLGDGLYLQIQGSARRYVVRFIDARKKRVWRTIGDAAVMQLAEARRQATDKVSAPTVVPKFRTLSAVAAEHMAEHAGLWKNPAHRQQWQSTLATYVLPELGAVPVDELTVDMVASVLRPLMADGKIETLRRVRGRIETLINAEAARLQTPIINPADKKWLSKAMVTTMSKAKGPGRVEHHEAPTIAQLQALWPRLEGSPAHLVLKWVTLTACRVTEAREAVWTEINRETRVWTVPAERMKVERPHQVPLCDEAMAVLDLAAKGAQSPLLFPGPSGGPISEDTARQRLQRLTKSKVTVHGIRSTFRDWAADTGESGELAELALAHTPDKVTAAYRRTGALEQRRPMMERWAAVVVGKA